MATDFNQRQADWAKREKARELEERKGEVKVGEALGKVTGDIEKSDEVKVRIDHVETLRLESPIDLKKDDPIRVTLEADSTKRGQEKQGEKRKREAKIGEAFGEVTKDISIDDDIRVRIDDVESLKFKPSVDLKKGDYIRVTVEKV
jgi:hypothetical protein